MVITIVNSKGGVGKTTLAVHTAAWLHDCGLNVAAIDADQQSSTSQWLPRVAPDIPIHQCTTAHDILVEGPRLAGRHDIVVADGPAALHARIGTLVSIADLAVVPVLPSMLDVWASYRTARLIYRARFRPKRPGQPQALTVLNRAQSRTRLAGVAAAAVQHYGFPVSPVVLESRMAYAEACERGTVVWRLGRRAARATAEMTRLCEVMLENLPRSPETSALRARCCQAREARSVLARRTADAASIPLAALGTSQISRAPDPGSPAGAARATGEIAHHD